MNTQYYRSKDFYLSAYLIASGFPLASAKKTAGLTEFEFIDTATLNSHIEKYYGFTAQVNPVTYGNAMRTLKTIIHSNTNDTEHYHTHK